MPKYSIVVPLHNEQENVTDLYDRLKAVMEVNGESFEIVLVDDGSRDRTFDLLREIAAVDSRVTVVRLRRNFGLPVSITPTAITLLPWMAICSMTPRTYPYFWKKLRKAMTSSADGASSESIISGCAAFLPAARTG
jgi:cellulose synthase/poly-beta-1,6-N-acetylglucosamine synthase-like glycosyltransferase